MNMKRFDWIDTLKGIGITLVVASHIYTGEIRSFLGIFSMPLFFFIGGFLYSSKYDNQVYFKRKIVHLIVPYIAFILLLYPIQLIALLPQRQGFSVVDILKLILNPIIGGTFLWGLTSAFWFTTCFFITQQLANFIIRKVNPNQIIFYIIVLSGLSYLNYLVFKQFFLPQNAHVALAGTSIFLIGFLYRKLYSERNHSIISISVLFFVLCMIIYSNQASNLWSWSLLGTDMKRANYGMPVFSLLLAIGLILLLIDISKLLVKNAPLISKIIGALGQASMSILYLHLAFIYALKGLHSGISYIYLFVFSTALSFMIHAIMLKFSFTRAIFLGSYSDFEQIFLTRNQQV